MITWRTVLNFVDGYGLRWNVAERVQSFTHPLWLGCLVGLAGLGVPLYGGTLTLSILLTAAAGWRIVAEPERRLAGAFVLFCLAASRPFVDYSTSGLESPLSHFLLIVLCLRLLREPTGSRGELFGDAMLSALLLLNRLDLALLVGPAWLIRAVQLRGRMQFTPVLLGVAPLAAWLVFAVIYYGAPLPNTAPAKLNLAVERPVLLAHGWQYLVAAGRLDPVTLPLLAGGALAGWWKTGLRERALAAGVLLSVAYVVWIGGDFMLGRFLTPALVVAAVVLITQVHRLPRRAQWALTVVAAALMFAKPTSPARTKADLWDESIDSWGIADERAFYFRGSGLFRPRDEFSPPVAKAPPVAGVAIVRLGGGGKGPTQGGAREHLVDPMALPDPLLARLKPSNTSDFRAGHTPRDIPTGYLESLRVGRNLVGNPEIAALWDDVVLATQAPLLAPGRAAAIWRLNTGAHQIPQFYAGTPEQSRDVPDWPVSPASLRAGGEDSGSGETDDPGD